MEQTEEKKQSGDKPNETNVTIAQTQGNREGATLLPLLMARHLAKPQVQKIVVEVQMP